MTISLKKKPVFIAAVIALTVQTSFIAAGIPRENVSGITHPVYLKFPFGEWPLIIEDGEYPEDLIHDIINDISSFYTRFDSYEMESYPETKKFITEGNLIDSKKYLQFDGTKSFVHPMLREHFGSLVDVDGKTHIVLPRTLVNIYREPVNWKRSNLNIHRKLIEFIDRINSLSDKTVDYNTAKELYYMNNISKEELQDLKRNFEYGNAPYIKNDTYYKPSLLDIRKESLNSTDYILCEVTSYNRISEMIAKIILIYDAGEWKIIIPNTQMLSWRLRP